MLRLIAAFKFSQALTLVAVAMAVFQLLRPEIAVLVQGWVETLPIAAEQNVVQHAVGWATGLAPHQVLGIGLGALLYAALFFVEGVGLWRRRVWAEWLTVVATALPIPLEVWEVVAHVSRWGVLALSVNVAVVWLLAWRLRQKQRAAARALSLSVPEPIHQPL